MTLMDIIQSVFLGGSRANKEPINLKEFFRSFSLAMIPILRVFSILIFLFMALSGFFVLISTCLIYIINSAHKFVDGLSAMMNVNVIFISAIILGLILSAMGCSGVAFSIRREYVKIGLQIGGLLLIILAESTILFTFSTEWMNNIEYALVHATQSYNPNVESTMHMDSVQSFIGCCGREGPSDYDISNIYYNKKYVPITCCDRSKLSREHTCEDMLEDAYYKDQKDGTRQVFSRGISVNYTYSKGCHERMSETIWPTVIGVVTCQVSIMVAAIIISSILCILHEVYIVQNESEEQEEEEHLQVEDFSDEVEEFDGGSLNKHQQSLRRKSKNSLKQRRECFERSISSKSTNQHKHNNRTTYNQKNSIERSKTVKHRTKRSISDELAEQSVIRLKRFSNVPQNFENPILEDLHEDASETSTEVDENLRKDEKENNDQDLSSMNSNEDSKLQKSDSTKLQNDKKQTEEQQKQNNDGKDHLNRYAEATDDISLEENLSEETKSNELSEKFSSNQSGRTNTFRLESRKDSVLRGDWLDVTMMHDKKGKIKSKTMQNNENSKTSELKNSFSEKMIEE